MGDTWITDMTHFIDVLKPDADIPGPVRRLAEYLGRIVETATVAPPLIWLDTAIRCRRRPGRRPCPGHLKLVRNDDIGEILWECTSCDDRGSISGWEGTPWDRSLDNTVLDDLDALESESFEPLDREGLDKLHRSGGTIEIVFGPAEYSVACRVCRDNEIPASILDGGERRRDGFKVTVSARNSRALRDYFLDIAVSEKNPSVRQLLGQVVKKIGTAVDAYLDEIF